jgi:hypothetical protein
MAVLTRSSFLRRSSSPPFILIADIISTVEFDETGDYLATGDKGGRVVLFERNDTVSNRWLWMGGNGSGA